MWYRVLAPSPHEPISKLLARGACRISICKSCRISFMARFRVIQGLVSCRPQVTLEGLAFVWFGVGNSGCALRHVVKICLSYCRACFLSRTSNSSLKPGRDEEDEAQDVAAFGITSSGVMDTAFLIYGRASQDNLLLSSCKASKQNGS